MERIGGDKPCLPDAFRAHLGILAELPNANGADGETLSGDSRDRIEKVAGRHGDAFRQRSDFAGAPQTLQNMMNQLAGSHVW